MVRRRIGLGLSLVLFASLLVVIPAVSGLPRASAVEPPPGGLVPSVANFDWVKGDFSVDDDGSAHYSVPLWMPKGRGDVQPPLALSYSSGSGNGPLGVGWSLSGLSSVTPCRRTLAQDGALGAVRYDASDAYCLDGSRLWPVGAHANGQREYRTERESFARVVAYGAANAVPDFFRVWAKDGRISTFGETDESRLRAYRLSAGPSMTSPSLVPSASPVTAAWHLNRIEDRNGNAATIEYAKSTLGDASNLWSVEMRPGRITYGPNRRVTFTYASRMEFDPSDTFSGGVHTRSTQRLIRITMEGGPEGGAPEVLRRYNLSYRNDSISGRSLLTGVGECDPSVCLRPLEFTWSLGSNEFDVVNTTARQIGSRIVAGDVNGDGRDDLLHLETCAPDDGCDRNRWSVRRSVGTNAQTFGPHELTGIPRGKQDPDHRNDIRPVDVDQDGRLDAMAEVDPDGDDRRTEYKLYRNDGTSYAAGPDLTPDHDSVIETDLPYFLDLDGNGAGDFVMPFSFESELPSSRYHYRLNNGGTFAALTNSQTTSPRGSSARMQVLDHDGDGRASLLVPNGFGAPPHFFLFGLDDGGVARLRRDAEAGVNLPFPPNSDPRDMLFADVNGDGLRDAVYPLTGLRTQLGTGRGFSPLISGPPGYFLPPVSGDKDLGVRIGDFTNDGRDDVMLLLRGEPTSANDTQHGVQLYSWRNGGFERVPLNEPAGLSSGIYHPGSGMSSTQPLDVDGDGVLELVRLRPATPTTSESPQVLKRRGGRPDLMIAAGVASGPMVDVTYTTLGDASVHEPATCGYPVTCAVRGGTIVAEHSFHTRVVGTPLDTYRHTYKGARTDLQGRGWLGFAEHRVTRALTGASTVTTFDNATRDPGIGGYPLASLPKTVTHIGLDGSSGRSFRKTVTNNYVPRGLGGRRHTVELRDTTEVEEERPASTQPWEQVRRRRTDVTYDGFGNKTLVRTATTGGRTTTKASTFRNDTASWLIGLTTRELTTGGLPSGCATPGACVTRESTFDYDERGNRTLEVIEPTRAAMRLSTTTAYGAAGEVRSVTRRGSTGPARTESFEYDADLLHPTATVNAADHRVTMQTHSGLGVTLSRSGPNPGVKETMKYDRFGRLRETNRSDGSFERITHQVSMPRQAAITDVSGGGRTGVVTDGLGREVQRQTRMFSGGTAVVDTTYDALGRAVTVTRPEVLGALVHQVTTTEYDNRDRPIRVTAPDGRVTRHEYVNRETHTYDAKNVHSYQVATVDGDVGATFDDDPASTGWLRTRFEYRPFGETAKVIAADNTEQVMEYDVRGRRERLVDPSSGTTNTTYTPFGEVATETNGAGEVTTYTYDSLGRVTRAVSPDGTATNTWDTATNGLGKLASARSTDAVVTTYAYDDQSRPSVTTWNIENVGYRFDHTYDAIGRPAGTEYPAVPGASGRLKTIQRYNPNGYLSSVADAAAGGPVYWTAQGRDAAGQLTQELFHNGVRTTHQYDAATGLETVFAAWANVGTDLLASVRYEYDANRNVSRRNDTVNDRDEQYGYDELNRLTRWAADLTPGLPAEKDVAFRYDGVGNLTAEILSSTERITYAYGEGGAPRHALTSRDNARYEYDAAGRQTSGAGRTVQYNRRNLPKVLTWGQGQSTAYRYDADGARVLKRDADHTVITVGGLFERRNPAGTGGTEVHNLHNILVDGRVVAQVNRIQAVPNGPTSDPRVQYLNVDRQGSTVMVTNAAGRPVDGDPFVAKMYYDPFGRRVDDEFEPLGNQRRGGPRQGYTGHVQDHEYGLIDMKGRIYDPETRHFLTPDPLIQDPLFSQSHNRYAYVWNNPTTRVDPTGLQNCVRTDNEDCVGNPDQQVSVLEEEALDQGGQDDAPECVLPVTDDSTTVSSQAQTGDRETQAENIDGDLGNAEGAYPKATDFSPGSRHSKSDSDEPVDLWTALTKKLEFGKLGPYEISGSAISISGPKFGGKEGVRIDDKGKANESQKLTVGGTVALYKVEAKAKGRYGMLEHTMTFQGSAVTAAAGVGNKGIVLDVGASLASAGTCGQICTPVIRLCGTVCGGGKLGTGFRAWAGPSGIGIKINPVIAEGSAAVSYEGVDENVLRAAGSSGYGKFHAARQMLSGW